MARSQVHGDEGFGIPGDSRIDRRECFRVSASCNISRRSGSRLTQRNGFARRCHLTGGGCRFTCGQC